VCLINIVLASNTEPFYPSANTESKSGPINFSSSKNTLFSVKRKLNTKIVWASLFMFMLLIFPTSEVHSVQAESNDSIRFTAFHLFSPLNRTYSSNSLTLNLTFGASIGLKYLFNYDIDGKYKGSIPFVINNPTETHVVYKATGFVKLPELPDGSHRLSVYMVVIGYQSNKNLAYTGTVFFAINSTPLNVWGISLENMTYTAPDVPLNFTVNENSCQLTYSLDGKENVTIAGNTTLTGLSNGTHNLIVYARDDFGNIGSSKEVNFDISNLALTSPQSPETLPIGLYAIAFTAIMVVVAGGILAYSVRAKHAAKRSTG
jgi:hypothetical protein